LFTANQPLIFFFTVTNPTPSTAFSANLTIEHEWYLGSGGSHGATFTLPLVFNDEPFLSSSFVYRADATLTPNGIHLVVKSLTTTVSKTLDIATGSSGISASRQHFGNFRISITSKLTGGGAFPPSSLRSPAYAYVLHPLLVRSRLLGFSQTVPTLPDGTFATTNNNRVKAII
jgi:hypothetical protein